jgi:hypothetical protein
MKIYSFILFLFLGLTSQVYGQVPKDFKIYTLPTRFGDKALNYFKEENGLFETKNVQLLAQGTITNGNDTIMEPAKVIKFLNKFFPDKNSEGMVVIDWERGIFQTMAKRPEGDKRFIRAETKFLDLIDEIKKHRPRIKVAVYQLPVRAYKPHLHERYNTPGKWDNLLSKTDFICPSVYIVYPDEQKGHQWNLDYIKLNLDVALIYGKRFNKPVMPFFWHRVHFSNDNWGKQIIQKEVLADYVKLIANYSYNGYRVSGAFWWDGVVGRLKNLRGIDGHLKGKVYNEETHDQMIINHAKAIKNALSQVN